VESQAIGATQTYLPQVASTNTVAESLAATLSHGHVLYTFDQTAGRGQQQNAWWCNPGHHLCVSIVLRPNGLPTRQLFALNYVSALAVADLCHAHVPDHAIAVKWPNDVVIDGRKVAGILTETSIAGPDVVAIVGIGLNVAGYHMPDDLKSTACTLSQMGAHLNPEQALQALTVHLNRHYNTLMTNGLESLTAQYTARLYRKGQQALFRADGQTFGGTITGVGADGELIMATDAGIRTFVAKQIAYL